MKITPNQKAPKSVRMITRSNGPLSNAGAKMIRGARVNSAKTLIKNYVSQRNHVIEIQLSQGLPAREMYLTIDALHLFLTGKYDTSLMISVLRWIDLHHAFS